MPLHTDVASPSRMKLSTMAEPRQLDKDNKENITLIWFDPRVDNKDIDTQETMVSLKIINDFVVFFPYADLDECIAYIKQRDKDTIFLVTSGKKAEEVLEKVSDFKQIDSIFVFCLKQNRYIHLKTRFEKIIGIFTQLDELQASIREQVDFVNMQMESCRFFDLNPQRSMRDLSTQSAEFLWFQIFVFMVHRLPHDDAAKQQMLTFCQHYYKGNTTMLEEVDEFKKTCNRETCINWYTKQTFVYKLVNKALRTEDIEMLHKFRFFIVDLSAKLRGEYNKQYGKAAHKNKPFTVYRGTKLSDEELKNLERNKGNLISTNGYLSTSHSEARAIEFAKKPTDRMNLNPVLYVIECNPTEQSLDNPIVFADIAEYSAFGDEDEMLFDLDAVFKICKVKPDDTLGLRVVTMKLNYEGRERTKLYTRSIHRDMQYESDEIIFGDLLVRMGQYQKALRYFTQLHETVANNKTKLAHIYNGLASVFREEGNYDKALEHAEEAYKLIVEVNPPQKNSCAHILLNRAKILHYQQHYSDALRLLCKALELFKEMQEPCDQDIAFCLHRLGGNYLGLGEYDKALDFYERSLQMNRKHCDQEDHLYIAETLNDLGVIYSTKNKSEEALEFYTESFEMYERLLPHEHSYKSVVLINKGCEYYKRGNLSKAHDYLQRAFTMQQNCLPPNHPFIASTKKLTTSVSNEIDKQKNAREFHNKFHALKEADNMIFNDYMKDADRRFLTLLVSRIQQQNREQHFHHEDYDANVDFCAVS